ncbi:MmgE/PrpD family protein [Pseudarthrobacter sp. H3Y2-7]|uniref:MmgE/PrpD family protein n=1 Tax=Pseudarthrobacter naphthalenicus TaxID=3031328 RepID=UPI0023AFD693|nr:MmgE/PrpD family protein [Pseudarthrobacter sp. H3Y2-7]MDE8670709.1 MmgE/PrpD family protein [Pseudarthrobacter sp. H3Y2-7]
MNNNSFARQLARHASARHTPGPEVSGWMRLLLLDYLAITTGGVERDSAVAVRASVSLSPTRTEDKPALVQGTGAYASVQDAALLNGVTSHGLELDDTFEEASLHPAVVIFPAVLAVADDEGHSVDEVLHAATIGYDVMCDTGVLLGAAESYGRGFHPTGVAGVIGAAAAVATLLGLTEDQTTHAVALAANLAAGSLEFLSDGSWTKRLNAGHASASGIRAARLAQAGFTAPERAIEGRDGFLNQYGKGWVEGRALNLEYGKSALATSIKFYPCCRYMHGNIDLLRDIHRENPGLAIEDIDVIETAVLKAGATLVSEPPERKLIVNTPVDAQFNMPFGAAVALATGDATVAQFEDAPRVAKGLEDWLRKVVCYTSDRLEAAFPASWQAEVRVKLKDGTVIERSEDAFRGSPTDRATREQLVDKAAGLIGRDAAEALDRSIAELDGAEPLAAQLAYPSVAAVNAG